MKTKEEIKEQIKNITSSQAHIFNQKCADITINAPLALMQLSAGARLDVLYWVLEEMRPSYKYYRGTAVAK